MMDEFNYLASLYDYYQGLLTEKQRSYFEDYYFDNLLMEVKEKLLEYERILKLYANKQKINEILDEESCKKIEDFI